MDMFDYCIGRCHEKKFCDFAEECNVCKIEVTVYEDLPYRVFCMGFNQKNEVCKRDDKPIGTLKTDGNNWEINMNDLSEEIQSKVKMIESILNNGNSAEIKRNTDGSVKVFEVEKRKR